MRLWFAPSSEVPIYRQLATQVMLAILSGELEEGEQLPSTRELARRFAVHPNTISAGYQSLERDGWTERRHGSRIHVRRQEPLGGNPGQILDRHIAAFFRAAHDLGVPHAEVRARVAHWLAAPRPDHFLLIDPDPLLRQILLTEIRAASKLPAEGDSVEQCAACLDAAIPLARPSRAKEVRAALPAGIELITLRIRSANAWLSPWLPVADGALIAVVSHWPEFLTIAQAMLIAAGVSADAIMLRNPQQAAWRQGLGEAAAILCDAYTATLPHLPGKPLRIVFPLLADDTLTELAAYAARL